jgi:hypothetical protein
VAFERERQALREAADGQAKVVDVAHNPFTGITVMVRHFPMIRDELRDLAHTYLSVYASAGNPNPATQVVNPYADGKAWPGTWRSVNVSRSRFRTAPEEQGLYQTLCMGSFVLDWQLLETKPLFTVHRYFAFASATMPTLPADSAGIHYQLSGLSFDDQRGTWSAAIDKMTAIKVENYGQDKRITYFQTETSARDFNLPAAPTLPAALTPGTIEDVSIERNDFAQWDRRRSARVATAREWSYSYTDPSGTIYVYEGRNVPEATADAKLASLTNITENRASKEPTDFGLFDYRITKSPKGGGGGGRTPFENYAENEDCSVTEFMTLNGVRYRRTLEGKRYVCGNSDPTVVIAYLKDCNYRCRVDPDSHGRFFQGEGIKVTVWTSAGVAWQEDMKGITS